MVHALARPSRVADNFRDDAVAKYGRPVAESFLVNYSEKLWGVPAERLSVQVSGSRLQGLDVKSALRDLLGLRHGEHLDGAFLYPRGGFGQITDALAARLRHVHTGAKVQRVLHADQHITAIILASGQEISPKTVVSSLPLPTFIRMLDPPPPQRILDLAASLRLRSVRLAVLLVEVAAVSGSASLYFPCADVPFTRLYEPKHRSSALAPAHRTCVVLEHPIFPGDTIDGLSRADFLAMAQKALLSTGLLPPRALLDGTDQMVQDAYPVLDVGASARVSAVDNYLDCFTNLHRIGRASCFRYSHLHSLMRDGRLLAERIVRDSSHVPRDPADSQSTFPMPPV
jgi:protoporphyrinogen oxidase